MTTCPKLHMYTALGFSNTVHWSLVTLKQAIRFFSFCHTILLLMSYQTKTGRGLTMNPPLSVTTTQILQAVLAWHGLFFCIPRMSLRDIPEISIISYSFKTR